MGASLLKVLETVSRRAIDNFQSPLKRFTSDRQKISQLTDSGLKFVKLQFFYLK